MTHSRWFPSMVVVVFCLLSSPQQLRAQTVDPSLQNIRTAIIQATGVPAASFDLRVKDKIFIVSRINSTMNQTNHAARDGEASRIAGVVAKSIADIPAYQNIHTIRVRYVATLKATGQEKVVDSIDFRRDPSGVFHFHAT